MPDGSLDTTFTANVGPVGTSRVNTLAVSREQRIVVGGLFTSIRGVARMNVARLNPDGKVIVAGDFNFANGVRRDEVARFLPDGSLDSTFDPGPTLCGRYGLGGLAVAAQADGKVLVGGDFTETNDVRRPLLARFLTNGAPDMEFAPPLSDRVRIRAIVALPNGKLLLAGSFVTAGGSHVARLNSNGSLDSTFTLSSGAPSAEVRGLAAQVDGKILLAGYFYSVGGAPRAHVARLNDNGSLDMTFNPGTGADHDTAAVAVQPDGKIVIGGETLSVAGHAHIILARYHGVAPLMIQWLNRPFKGPFTLRLNTLPSATYTLEASTDLLNWLSIGTQTAPGDNLDWLDPDAPNFQQRFYRVRRGN
jgi:uncharacterized delta-60 repeat protein